MAPRSLSRRTALAALAATPLAGRARAEARPALVAAASDLQVALPELVQAFTAATSLPVELVLGSSGALARQIRRGAPFELFLSADEDYVLDLARDGLARDTGALYAVGRLALLVPNGSPLRPDGTLADLEAALRDGRLRRFAIANPEHAPYGRRAEEALRHRLLWEAIRRFLVLGENVSQAAQFALSGNAEGGLVAWSLALAPAVRERARAALVPEAWHTPLRQRMALLGRAGRTAERLYAFLQEEPARAVLRRSGFLLPGEAG